jgi:hypothetical protein
MTKRLLASLQICPTAIVERCSGSLIFFLNDPIEKTLAGYRIDQFWLVHIAINDFPASHDSPLAGNFTAP